MRSSLILPFLALTSANPISPSSRDVSLVTRGGAKTENDLLDGPCKPVTLIFARGTGQGGNIGNDVGPSLMNEVAKRVGDKNLARQGVKYDASWVTFPLGGDLSGKIEAWHLIRDGVKKCPKSKFVLAGHSQGAQIISGGMARCSDGEVKHIAAVVLFGAPPNSRDPFPEVASSRIKVICHKGDSICEGSLFANDKHNGYDKDTDTAADFIASKV